MSDGAAPDPARDETILGSGGSLGLPGASGAPPVSERTGEEIGAYRLISLLGEGGFGEVWLAERRHPFVQRVAIKIIKPGMDSRAVIARFEQERQALAVMAHPGIAKVLDGGLTARGRPFFVMEHVRGQPITEFCDSRRLPLRERLRLFLQVCEAIQHAHLRGIIHRDIKPSNVLAFDVEGGEPAIKVIDFGVAKATQRGGGTQTIFTETGQMIGTLEYMSPEQADASTEDIDTRADVYSLGAVLYELLAGVTPHDSQALRAQPRLEQRRTVAEGDLPAPSERVSGIGQRDPAHLQRIAEARRESGAGLLRSLRRELEWIPLKATRRERQERYQSATDLARDVRNYLGGRPLVAGPETARYRVRKFVRRNRALVLGAAAVTGALAVGLALTFWQWREAVEARNDAVEREREAVAVTKFVTDSLVRADPMQGGDKDLTVKDAMAQAVEALGRGSLRGQPDVEVRLRNAIGLILLGNADYAGATAVALEARRIGDVAHPEPTQDRAMTLKILGAAARNENRLDEAERLLSDSLAMREAALGPMHAEVADGVNELATLYRSQGKFDRAEPLFRKAVEVLRTVPGSEDDYLPHAINNLAVIYDDQGRYKEAEPLYREALAMWERTLGPDHPDVANAYSNLAALGYATGDYAGAEANARKALAIREKALPAGHPAIGEGLNNLAAFLYAQKKFDEALPLYERALANFRAALGDDHPLVATGLNNVASLHRLQKRNAEAEPLFVQALAIREKALGPDHPDTGTSLNNLGLLFLDQGDFARAEPLLVRAEAVQAKQFVGDHPLLVKTRQNLAKLYRATGREDEAKAVEARTSSKPG
jgi:non-specific serine/threonine protein kinase/serine/threonine-protein kinase